MAIDAASLDILVKLTQLIGIPVGIIVYGVNKRRERIDREYGTYNALDEKYIDYLKLCLENPDLDVADTPQANVPPLTAEQTHRQLIMFSILLSIMERAYLMYKDESASVRQKQWSGWDEYIADWHGRPNFAAAMSALSDEFDASFCAYLKRARKSETKA